MMRMMTIAALWIAGAVAAPAWAQTPATAAQGQPATAPGTAGAPSGERRVTADPPELPREFRGGWVSSVNNGTWPPRPGMTADEQRAEAIRQLDRAVQLKLNAIIFQVRPAADALYRSKLEPWSEYLSGTQGRDPGYDPLEFWVTEAHKRGLELHAWLNPYRAKHKSSKSAVAPNHISRTMPLVVKSYDGYLWLDPGEPAAAQHSMKVFLDIVRRYDVDGIHMDDYFYPYRGGEKREFPDDRAWQRYQRSGGKLARNDWRRDNINQFIRTLYEQTKKIKPHVKVGVAPFGIWRPENPPGIKGMDAHEAIYTDTRLWVNEGWLDYFGPQLYWPIEGPQSFSKLLDWWIEQNHKQRHIWPGMSVGRYIPKDGSLSMEVPNQIGLTRDRAGSSGFIIWPLGRVMPDTSLSKRLMEVELAEPALIPPSPWLDDKPPAKPVVRLVGAGDKRALELRPGLGGGHDNYVWLWAVQTRHEDGWKLHVLPGNAEEFPVGDADRVAVTAIDRTSNASERVTIDVATGAGATASGLNPR